MGTREEMLAAVAEAHYQWSKEHESTARFRPEDNAGSRDYNVEHVDLEADGTMQDDLVRRINSSITQPGTGAPSGDQQ